MIPTVISTFSGCGGSSCGYRMAGCKVRLAVEFDDNAVACYKANFPDTQVFHGDIATLTSEEAMRITGLKPGELDIFDGSPPCQGFSLMGRRKVEDPRNQLFREYCRLLGELQPKTFVMENVPAMIHGRMKAIYNEVQKSLRNCGYKVKAQVLAASAYRVPSIRKRLIFIGVRNDLNIVPSFPRGSRYQVTVREAFRGVPSDENVKLEGKAAIMYPHIEPGDDAEPVHKKMFGSEALYSVRRLEWNKPACTLTKIMNPAVAAICHPEEARVITIAEAKRLQSFPDSFIFVGNNLQKWARIGNSVPPLLMKAIATHIRTEILQKIAHG